MNTISIKSKIYSIVMLVIMAACSVEELDRANYVAFQSNSVELVTPAVGSGSAELNVYTTTTSGSERTFTIEVVASGTTADPANFTVPSSVTIPANSNVGTFIVESDAVNIGKSIVLRFTPTESINIGSTMTVNVYEECLEQLLFLDIKFDTYPDEFAWEIVDSEGNVVAGKNFGAYPRNPAPAFRLAQIRERICLPLGSYTFTAYDAYGDGMFDGSNTGNFFLRRVSNGETLATDSGDFGLESSTDFELD